MHDCEQMKQALLDAADGELSWFERLRLRLHLLLCAGCRREEASLDRTLRLLRRCGQCSAGASGSAPPSGPHEET